ncbi:hypothetical protein FQA39_LY06404 [Lamprigera yunnana]|nr:hypothetical protein FQA39_LY06404 [Lamprigera yunnana]
MLSNAFDDNLTHSTIQMTSKINDKKLWLPRVQIVYQVYPLDRQQALKPLPQQPTLDLADIVAQSKQRQERTGHGLVLNQIIFYSFQVYPLDRQQALKPLPQQPTLDLADIVAQSKQRQERTGHGLVLNQLHYTLVCINIISSIISTQVEGFTSEFDGDALDDVMSNTEEIVVDEETVSSLSKRSQSPKIIPVSTIFENSNLTCDYNISEKVAVESSSKSGNNSNWGKYTPEMLKTQKNKALQSGSKVKKETVGKFCCSLGVNNFVIGYSNIFPGNCRKTDLKTKLSQWAATKQLFVNTQEECFKREHELTMKHKKQKHEQEMRHAEKLQQERLRQMREEH